MSQLSNKINSYTLERGFAMEETVTLTPTRTGTNPLGTFTKNSGTAIVYEPTVGPAGGNGSWLFPYSTTTNNNGFFGCATGSTTEVLGVYDLDYSTGFWVKINSLPTGSSNNAIPLVTVGSGGTAGYIVGVSGSTHSTNPSSFMLDTANSFTYSTTTITAGQWYYVAVTRSGNTQKLYINGTQERSFVEAGSGTLAPFNIGSASSRLSSGTFNISNFYLAPTSVIGPTQIAEIYTAGTVIGGTDISITETPATATATIPNPGYTIVNISFNATAITANAEFAPADGIPQASVSILSPVLTASATQINPAISTIRNVNFIVWGADIENGGWFGLLAYAGLSGDYNGAADPVVTTSTNLNIDADPFFIDPVSLEPTIVIADRENIEVVTSIPVSATIVQPAITVDLSLNIVLIETLDASATSVDATFSQTADANNYPEAFTASALVVDPSNIISDNQVAISATAYEASATIVEPPLIISDNAAIIYADIMTATGEIPNPGYGTPQPDPLFWRSGTLQSKIATYPIQWGVEFNSANKYSNIPMYGSALAASPASWTGYGNALAYYDATVGPYASGTGSLRLNYGANIRSSNTTMGTSISQGGIWTDLNYTTGLWFKLAVVPNSNLPGALNLLRIGTSTWETLDFSVNVTGSAHPTNPTQLSVSLNGTYYDYLTTPTLNTTDWHYLAVRRTGSAGVNNFEVYIDGQLKLVKTNSDTLTTYNRLNIGGVPSAAITAGEWNVQNFHLATADALTSYEIDQIWQAGTKFPPAQSVNAVHSADRFLATALAMSPTIISTKGDHIEVTTSVTVSSEFPEPSWSTGDNLKINAGSFGGIQATIGDNVQIETNGDKSITPVAHTATAILVEPILARQPAKANASLPMPLVYTAPNYFEMVMVHEPVFYIEDGGAVPNNYGSWQESTNWERVAIDVNVQSGKQMNAVGNQKSWMANAQGVVLVRPRLQADIPDYRTKINDLYATRNLTIEVWYTSIGYGSTVNPLAYQESGPIFDDGITQITEVWDFFGCVPGSDPQNKIMLIGERLKSYDFSGGLADAFATWRSFPDANPKRDEWNHLVVTYEAVTNPGQVRRKIYLNGGVISNQLLTIGNSSINPSGSAFADDGYIDLSLDQPQNIWQGPSIGGGIQLSGSQTIKLHDGVKVDEFAIYPKTLSGTQVVEHYNFITSLSPDANYNSTVTEFLVEIGNHQVLPSQNTLYDEDPMPALAARIPEPLIIAGVSKILAIDTSEADSLLVNPLVITESIHYVDAMIANANLETVYVANNQYYNYVKTIPNLHRYYSFDTATPSTNHGNDSTYSVPDITVAGEIVQYGQSINNKSAITAGLTPLNGITLYESQHDDSWGSVGNGNFFTSFWMERPYTDFSSSGLRVVANINSPSNNHYVLLYQLSGLLWLDSWNGTTLTRTSSTTNPALFDYNTHQVLISFDNANQNARHIRVYVDKVLFIEQNLGSIDLNFVNGGVDAPNDSANNYPRMSLGSLITPFETTSLPQYPANIRTVYDEIIWANTDATSTIINALYNNMPTRTNSLFETTALEASYELVNPTISTGTTISTEAMLAFPAQTEPSLSLEFSIDILIDSFEAYADINNIERSDSIVIVADLFLATFGLGFAGAPRIINATPLTASLALVNRTVTGVQTGQGNGILINGQRTFDPNSKWVQYVLTTTENTLIPMREVR